MAKQARNTSYQNPYYQTDDYFDTSLAVSIDSLIQEANASSIYELCMESKGYYQVKDSHTKSKKLTVFQKAEKGDASAQNHLGVQYQYGEGVEQNFQEAFKWYKKAAEQGHEWAQNNIAALYYRGKGVEQNYEEAFKWFLKAAKQGLPRSQNNVGSMYIDGQGVEQNYQEALKWFMKAAEQGDADAQYGLGQMYSKGRGVEQNDQEAIKWYKKAAEQGNAEAQKELDSLLSQDQVNKQKRTAESSRKSSKGQKHKKNVVGLGEYCSYHGDCERGLACNESKMCEDVNRYLQRQLSQGKFGKPCSKHTDCKEDGTLCDQQFNKCIETLLWRQKYKDENNKEITVK